MKNTVVTVAVLALAQFAKASLGSSSEAGVAVVVGRQNSIADLPVCAVSCVTWATLTDANPTRQNASTNTSTRLDVRRRT